MNILRAASWWTAAVLSFWLLVLSFTRSGTGFAGGGNGMIWAYVFALLLVGLVLAPVLRRPAPADAGRLEDGNNSSNVADAR